MFSDHRLAHCGMPNLTPNMRQMVSLNYCSQAMQEHPDLEHRRTVFQGYAIDETKLETPVSSRQ